MACRQTNEEFVLELMRFSRFGALVQVFVLQALQDYAAAVAAADPAKIESNALISTEAWIGVAREVHEKVSKHLAPSPADSGPTVEADHDPDEDPPEGLCTHPDGHKWVYTGTAYGGDDPSYRGEGRCYCQHCGADGDA